MALTRAAWFGAPTRSAAAPRRARRAAPAPRGAALSALARWMSEDLTDTRLWPRAAWALWWYPVAGAAALLTVFVTARPLFYWVTQEDRLLEWAQFAACLLACLLAGAAALRLARRGAMAAAATMALFCVGMFGLTGEEISWGQRVLGLATPDGLAAVNLQSETNVHNLEVGLQLGDVFKTMEFVICVGGIGLALLVRRTPSRLPARLDAVRFLAPPVAVLPAFAAMAVYQLAQGFVFPDTWDAVARMQEFVELGMYLGLAVLALTIYTGARRPAVGGTTPLRPRSRVGPGPERLPWALLAGVLVVTLACAVLTARSGILPGNL